MLSKYSATTDYLSGWHTIFCKWEMIKEVLTETVASSSDTQINNELCHKSFFSKKIFKQKNIYYSLSNIMNFMTVNSKIKSKHGPIYNTQAAKVSTEEVYRTNKS